MDLAEGVFRTKTPSTADSATSRPQNKHLNGCTTVKTTTSRKYVFQGGIQRADALCYTAFAGTITKCFNSNTKSVEYPRAGEARIACELSPARTGPASRTHRGALSLSPVGISFLFEEGRVVNAPFAASSNAQAGTVTP